MHCIPVWLVIALSFSIHLPVLEAAPLVVETDPLPPEEQRAKFHLPPGFEIQLIVSEPIIGQPMNISFDAAGRLYITSSLEYPYPAKGDGVEPREERFDGPTSETPRDWVTVVEGIGPDGKPAKVTRFASGLNIPIGNVPTDDGAIVFSIPNIVRYYDRDGDGKAEEHEVLYGKVGNLDTHGMAASFTRWIDGWVYATHGFRNTSDIKGKNGQGIKLNSGNTFRFKADGSAIEQFTWGQVNPFGLCFDHWGNAYTADCHSMPLTMLLRGAYYSSFGKPHDGLGYGPDMINHLHGSTGICGVAYYQAPQFPAEYQECLYLCNPVNGQVHRDKLDVHGSTLLANSQPDFITCDDGWFRPVDVKLGPDGALYVADFYNAVIGHYEVPLPHPRRDREKGRVWRIVYTGEGAKPLEPVNLATARAAELLDALASPNITVRTLATNEFVDRYSDDTDAPNRLLDVLLGKNEAGQVSAMWAWARAWRMEDQFSEQLLKSQSPLVRTHLARCLAEQTEWSDLVQLTVSSLLEDEHPMVRRPAADAAGRHPQPSFVEPLWNAWQSADPKDTQLVHTARIALRNHLAVLDIAQAPAVADLVKAHPSEFLPIIMATGSDAGAELLVTLDTTKLADDAERLKIATFIAQRIAEPKLAGWITNLREHSQKNPLDSLTELSAIDEGLRARGIEAPEVMRQWVADVSIAALKTLPRDQLGWLARPLGGVTLDTDELFVPQQRASADGNAASPFFNSIIRGEQKTGVFQSDAFDLPTNLSFFIAGHNDEPSRPAQPNNIVRLRDAATNEVLQEVLPPRNDMAQKIEWDLQPFAGRRGFIEVTDGDDRGAYAWLAVGRFSIEGLNPRDSKNSFATIAQLVRRYQIAEAAELLKSVIRDPAASLSTRTRAAVAMAAGHSDPRIQILASTVGSSLWTPEQREKLFAGITSSDGAYPTLSEDLELVMRAAPQQAQTFLAAVLSQQPAGASQLIDFVRRGIVSAHLLRRPEIAQRLAALSSEELNTAIADLTKNLPNEDEATLKLLAARKADCIAHGGDAARGLELFKKHCAACHQMRGEGQKIGPQLDGIGIRGLDRLLEDVLAPNRNVDAAFRSATVVTTNGQILIGLPRRVDGETHVFADRLGKEFSLPRSEIESQTVSPLSLMPSNFGELLPESDSRDLLRFLLDSAKK
ncbi:MAG: hypothetical protein DWH91_14385 [Planctomycetota bacterium]|nr:MAG: hypothetical protein DWH91_14385 [Planctomycetota bacterium]